MSSFYMLVGVPCVGKSTWLRQQKFLRDYDVISPDNLLMHFAEDEGISYSESQTKYARLAHDMCHQSAEVLAEFEENCVWDATNIVAKRRKKILDIFADYDERVAVTFNLTWPQHKRRIISRPDKQISMEVIEDMNNRYQHPTKAEGFTKIIEIRN